MLKINKWYKEKKKRKKKKLKENIYNNEVSLPLTDVNIDFVLFKHFFSISIFFKLPETISQMSYVFNLLRYNIIL